MKTKIAVAIGISLFLLTFNSNSALARRGNNSEADSVYVAGQMILQYNSQVSKSSMLSPYMDSLNQAFSVEAYGPFYYMDSETDMELFSQLGLDRVHLFIFPDTLDMFYVSEQYELSPDVNWAQPNFIYQYHLVPPDEYFPFQWGLQNTGQAPFYGTPGADVEATRAWDRNAENMPWKTIAILDSGIDTLHYDLLTRVWHNPGEIPGDGINNDGNYIVIPGCPDTCYLVDDTYGWNFSRIGIWCDCGDNYAGPTNFFYRSGWHGTAVAGVAGASAFTTPPGQPKAAMQTWRGIVGVNWNSHLMSLKLSDSQYGPTSSGIYFALLYAADKRADVINMSFGGRNNDFSVEIGVNYAYQKGCVLVASMGNCESGCASILYPAAYESVIAVGGTDRYDDRWFSDSNFASSYGEHIDVVAPAESVMSDLWFSWTGDFDTCYYFIGTSFAAPFVSGEAALIKGQYKQLYPFASAITNQQIMDVIRYSAEDSMYYPASPDTTWDDDSTGYGRINAFRALLAISRGEVNNDHTLSVADVVYLIAYLFQQGPPPVPVRGMGDCNCDGNVSVSDVTYLINYLTKGGAKPLICYKWYY